MQVKIYLLRMEKERNDYTELGMRASDAVHSLVLYPNYLPRSTSPLPVLEKVIDYANM